MRSSHGILWPVYGTVSQFILQNHFDIFPVTAGPYFPVHLGRKNNLLLWKLRYPLVCLQNTVLLTLQRDLRAFWGFARALFCSGFVRKTKDETKPYTGLVLCNWDPAEGQGDEDICSRDSHADVIAWHCSSCFTGCRNWKPSKLVSPITQTDFTVELWGM